MYRLFFMFLAITSVWSTLEEEEANEKYTPSKYIVRPIIREFCDDKTCFQFCPRVWRAYPDDIESNKDPNIGDYIEAIQYCEAFCPPKPCLQVFEAVNSLETRAGCFYFEGFGCVPYASFFTPSTREAINTTFVLYKKNIERGQTLDKLNPNGHLQSNLDPKTPTKFIIHGIRIRYRALRYDGLRSEVLQSYWRATGWEQEKLLEDGDYNVICVEWNNLVADEELYDGPVADTIVVGLEIANMIKKLKKTIGLKPEDVHLIGHGLGAHAAGYAGKYTTGLGRITGLDPANAEFGKRPNHHRLYRTDALFVDVIHSDAKTFGIEQPCGHVDFYPNGGSQQPNSSDSICDRHMSCEYHDISCSHRRAHELFTESIDSQCVFMGCGKGKDKNVCAVMGFNAKNPTIIGHYGKRYFLNTAEKPRIAYRNNCEYGYQNKDGSQKYCI